MASNNIILNSEIGEIGEVQVSYSFSTENKKRATTPESQYFASLQVIQPIQPSQFINTNHSKTVNPSKKNKIIKLDYQKDIQKDIQNNTHQVNNIFPTTNFIGRIKINKILYFINAHQLFNLEPDTILLNHNYTTFETTCETTFETKYNVFDDALEYIKPILHFNIRLIL
jgi:hypothetical protein